MQSKKILITGAGTGFGRDTAIALAKRGHHVIAATYDQAQADNLQTYAKDKQVDIDIEIIDITQQEHCQKAKNKNIDVLINNAAIGEGGALVEVPLERIRENLEVNVIGTLAMIQAVAPEMVERKSGTIIIVTSLGGRVPLPFLSPYSMSKYALESAGAALDVELKPFGINVSMIEPGPFGTGFNEQNLAKKFDWMGDDSIYKNKLDYIEESEKKYVMGMQKDDFSAVIDAMVTAAESENPKLRYAIPKWMGLGVNLLRGFGK